MANFLKRLLSSRADPLDVLKTTASVIEHARFVRLNLDAIERTADDLANERVSPPEWNYEFHFFDGTERSVNYLFLLDNLNFCFWGKPKWSVQYRGKVLDGYWALAASLKRALQKSADLCDPAFLAQITPKQMGSILHGNTTIPLFPERWRALRELGTFMRDSWGSSPAAFVADARRDAARLAQMLAEGLASFNDVAIYDDREVRFFKRAQILAADLWGAFNGKQWGTFSNIEVLTAFADYKLPQILRAWGILKYVPSLAGKVDAMANIASGSPEEIEIRASTLWAVELLREALAARGHKFWSTQIDWILWEASQARSIRLKPYHRTRSIYY